MKGDLRCIDGRLWRHDPQYDDPDLETDVGECPECSGEGCFEVCPSCDGTGRTDAGFYPCPYCRGRGEVGKEKDDEDR